jgi:hypothetical protein
MEQILAGLSNRIFLLNNTHEDSPEVFETRWAMSYLRGPLTRTQIKTLMDPLKGRSQVEAAAPVSPTTPTPTLGASASQGTRPVLPPEINQYYIPVRSQGGNGSLSYHPMLFANIEVHYSNSDKVDLTQITTLLTTIADGPVNIDWGSAVSAEVPIEDLEKEPQTNANFAETPAAASKAKSYDAWKKDLASWVYRNERLELLESPSLEIASNPGRNGKRLSREIAAVCTVSDVMRQLRNCASNTRLRLNS